MTLSEFQALDKTAQAEAVWTGKFVSSHVVDDVFIQRYRLNEFDVEVMYDPMANQILAIKPLAFS